MTKKTEQRQKKKNKSFLFLRVDLTDAHNQTSGSGSDAPGDFSS